MNIGLTTDIGLRRARNEDNGGYAVLEDGTILAIVCDGMGGHQAGDVASATVIDYVVKKFKDKKTVADMSDEEIMGWLATTIKEANRKLKTKSELEAELDQMGTTVVLALIRKDHVIYINVGDSRGYYYKGKKLTQVTEDHSLIMTLIKQGIIKSEEEAINHPGRNAITSSLGPIKETKLDAYKVLREKGYVLLTTDGVHGQMSKMDMQKIIKKSRSVQTATKELIDLSNKNGGKDNATAILIKV